MSIVRLAIVSAAAFLLGGCISAPPPKYQPGISNTQVLIQPAREKLGVGKFNAAPGVENAHLSVRGSSLNGGSDGTFSGYLRDALITELQTAGKYDANADTQISGTLTDNRLETPIKTGSADVAAHFVVTRSGSTVYDKTLSAHHEWESSFMGAVAIPTAMRNYATAVQKLLGQLFNDPDFIEATTKSGNAAAGTQ
ncbi:MAG TPA: hypothetical protein VFH71_01080 [Rhodanobacteraceae bacterium]|nr:hypothetical protein [Rhodanobacteraceae bacterium]